MKLRLRGGGAAALAFTLAAGLLLSACSSGGAAPAAGGDAGQGNVPAPQAPQDGGPSIDTRLIARTASVTVVVDDVKQAVQGLHDMATDLSGYVTTESVSLPEDTTTMTGYASVQFSVPADDFDTALGRIDDVGQVTNLEITSEDVTDQVVDTDSRITTMRDSIARLQQLMQQSGSVSDIAAVEAELTQRQADLEALLALQASLQKRVEMSTITVSVRTSSTTSDEGGGTTFGSSLRAGWNALGDAGHMVLIVLGALLPWLALAAIIGLPVWLIRRRRKAAAAAASGAGKTGAPHPKFRVSRHNARPGGTGAGDEPAATPED